MLIAVFCLQIAGAQTLLAGNLGAATEVLVLRDARLRAVALLRGLSEAETKTPAPSLHRAEAGPSRVPSETAGHCDALSSFLPAPRIAEGSLDCLEICRCSRRVHHGAECRTLPRLVKVLAAAISLPWHAAFSSPDEAQRALARLTAGEISDDLEGQV